MKTSEAWTMLADTIEDWGMPLNKSGYPINGLCGCIVSMNGDGFITDYQEMFMLTKLYERFSNGGVYFWPIGAVKPRIKACRILAELSE